MHVSLKFNNTKNFVSNIICFWQNPQHYRNLFSFVKTTPVRFLFLLFLLTFFSLFLYVSHQHSFSILFFCLFHFNPVFIFVFVVVFVFVFVFIFDFVVAFRFVSTLVFGSAHNFSNNWSNISMDYYYYARLNVKMKDSGQ